MEEKNVKQELTSNELMRCIMSVPSETTRKSRLLCKIFGHKRGGWSIKVENSLVKSTTHYCERCGHEEVIEMGGDTDRLDVAVAFAMGRPDIALERLVENVEY